MPFESRPYKSSIGTGLCSVTGYEKQSLRCANCRFNRVSNIGVFVNAAKTDNKTIGSYCSYKADNEIYK